MVIRVAFAVLGLCLSWVGGVWAADAVGKPQCPSEPIRVGLFEFGVMYSVERGSGHGFGIDRDLVQELERRSGCHFEGNMMARARIWVELREGRLDFTTAAVKTPDREAIAWMIPYLKSEQHVLLTPGLGSREQTLAGFLANRNLRFGVVRGFRHVAFYDQLIDQLRADGRVVEAVDEAQLMTMLRRGSIGAMVSSPIVYRTYLGQDPADQSINILQWNPKEEQVVAHLMFSRKLFSATEMEKWRAILDTMRRDGAMLGILQRYLGKEGARQALY